jgi:peptide-methionine (S)-S-oxide reductase
MFGPLSRWTAPLAIVALCLSAWFAASLALAESSLVVPPPAVDNPKVAGPIQTAVLAGGCFWGMQGVFEHVHGVRRVLSGYAGGDKSTANYETVSTGRTGHAESIEISFDPQQVSYGELLRIYFSVAHDPTELNFQGPDTGPQYRSSIFYIDATQKNIAQSYIAQLTQARVFKRAIVTRVDPLPGFYPAESYHQDYLIHNPGEPYIVYNDLPKIRALQALFPGVFQSTPVKVSDTKL